LFSRRGVANADLIHLDIPGPRRNPDDKNGEPLYIVAKYSNTTKLTLGHYPGMEAYTCTNLVLRILSRYLGGRISYILDTVMSCHGSSLSLTPVLLLLPNIPGQALWCSVSLRGVVTDSLLHFFELSSCWEQSLNPQALKL